MVVDRSDGHTTMTDTSRWAMLIYHLVTNLKRKISKCSYWDDWSLWGRGNIEFIHLLHRPSTFQHSETPELRESTHEVDQGVEDILITDPRFFLHKTHGRRYLKVFEKWGTKMKLIRSDYLCYTSSLRLASLSSRRILILLKAFVINHCIRSPGASIPVPLRINTLLKI